MAKADVDPEALRRFAFDLKHFNTELQSQLSSIQRRFMKLSESWRDQEQQKFAEVFEKMIVTINKFVEESDKNIPILIRKAQKVQDYLG